MLHQGAGASTQRNAGCSSLLACPPYSLTQNPPASASSVLGLEAWTTMPVKTAQSSKGRHWYWWLITHYHLPFWLTGVYVCMLMHVHVCAPHGCACVHILILNTQLSMFPSLILQNVLKIISLPDLKSVRNQLLNLMNNLVHIFMFLMISPGWNQRFWDLHSHTTLLHIYFLCTTDHITMCT